MDELTDEDLASISEVGGMEEEPSIRASRDIISDVKKKETARAAAEVEDMSVPELPPMEEDIDIGMPDVDVAPSKPAKPERAAEPAAEGIELTDRELNRVKKSILLYNPAVRQVVKDVVINDLLPVKDTRQLVNLILTGRSEGDIQKYLEGKLGRKIELSEEKAAAPVAGRRVITARPEYTAGGKGPPEAAPYDHEDFRRGRCRCLRAGSGRLPVHLQALGGKAHDPGRDGAHPRKRGDYLKKPKDYAKAEEIFRDVDANYIKDFVFGYTEYSRAYFDKKEYTYSIEKMNKIYAIQYKERKLNVELPILLRLGDFYAKVPAEYYNTMRLNINQWYYPGSQKKREEWSQLDVAIEFYRRVLISDAEEHRRALRRRERLFLPGPVLQGQEVLRGHHRARSGFRHRIFRPPEPVYRAQRVREGGRRPREAGREEDAGRAALAAAGEARVVLPGQAENGDG